MAVARTTVPRCTCQNSAGSRRGSRSFNGVRMRNSCAAVSTRTYLSAASNTTTSATGTSRMALPTLAWITLSRSGAFAPAAM